MTVSADGLYSIELTLKVVNKETGEEVTTTSHTDHALNYGAMVEARNAIIQGSMTELVGLGRLLAGAFGQGMADIATKSEKKQPGAIR